MRFVDTDVLLHTIPNDPVQRPRAERANTVLADNDLAITTHVLQEFHVRPRAPAVLTSFPVTRPPASNPPVLDTS
jgi:hypothetical protein